MTYEEAYQEAIRNIKEAENHTNLEYLVKDHLMIASVWIELAESLFEEQKYRWENLAEVMK